MALIWTDVKNQTTSTLNQAGVTAGSPTDGGNLTVADATNFPTSGIVLVDNELIYYSSKSGNNLVIGTSGRGYDNTTAASHTNGATVYADVKCAKHLNDLKNHAHLGTSGDLAQLTTNAFGTGVVATAAIAANAVTQTAGTNLTSGNVTTVSTSFVDLTGVTVTITTTGGDVLCFFSVSSANNNVFTHYFKIVADSTGGAFQSMTSPAATYAMPCSLVSRFSGLSAASHIFKVQWRVSGGTGTAYVNGADGTGTLIVVELKK